MSLVRRLCERWSNTWFVVDQSFLGMSRHRAELHEPLPDNVIVVRSLTKELGTPGVRVGYALVPPELSARLVAQRPAWTVSAAAQAAAMCYPRLLPSLEPQLASLLEHGQQLRGNLKQLGLRPFSSDTHYCVVPIAAATAATLTSQLLSQHGIYVRDCTSFGLPDCIRVSAHPQQQRLVNALGALLKDNAGSVQRKGLR